MRRESKRRKKERERERRKRERKKEERERRVEITNGASMEPERIYVLKAG